MLLAHSSHAAVLVPCPGACRPNLLCAPYLRLHHPGQRARSPVARSGPGAYLGGSTAWSHQPRESEGRQQSQKGTAARTRSRPRRGPVAERVLVRASKRLGSMGSRRPPAMCVAAVEPKHQDGTRSPSSRTRGRVPDSVFTRLSTFMATSPSASNTGGRPFARRPPVADAGASRTCCEPRVGFRRRKQLIS